MLRNFVETKAKRKEKIYVHLTTRDRNCVAIVLNTIPVCYTRALPDAIGDLKRCGEVDLREWKPKNRLYQTPALYDRDPKKQSLQHISRLCVTYIMRDVLNWHLGFTDNAKFNSFGAQIWGLRWLSRAMRALFITCSLKYWLLWLRPASIEFQITAQDIKSAWLPVVRFYDCCQFKWQVYTYKPHHAKLLFNQF